MKGKVLVSVKLAATGKSYEFRVPLDSTVESAATLMSRMLASREPARYEHTGAVDLMLLDGAGGAAAGDALNPNETFRALVEQGVLGDGSALAIV